MTDVTAPSLVPLRPVPGPDGAVCLTRADAVRVALALAHLSSFTHWSAHAQAWDAAIAADAAWMAETLGDAALTG